jgi:hypothetical protein
MDRASPPWSACSRGVARRRGHVCPLFGQRAQQSGRAFRAGCHRAFERPALDVARPLGHMTGIAVAGVAQSVRAPGCGPGGRRFKSGRSPHSPGKSPSRSPLDSTPRAAPARRSLGVSCWERVESHVQQARAGMHRLRPGRCRDRAPPAPAPPRRPSPSRPKVRPRRWIRTRPQPRCLVVSFMIRFSSLGSPTG